MADDEYVSLATAKSVLSTAVERHVSYNELTCVIGRLANLGLAHWRIRRGNRTHVRTWESAAEQRSGAAWFRASPAGVTYLTLPRDVT